MKYDAFISYRHTELDMEIAKKLHTALESYKVPIPVQKKTGKKKIRRVFRDQEELPIGSDLDDNITAAIRESEYLIVVCSPRAVASEWVMKEIDTFISYHDKKHILAVLIEGEPGEAFPPQLLTDDYGRPVEPLAADIRGADRKERNDRFKSEFLRLAAPVLGCTYDDLKQRHRERMIRKNLGIVAAIAGAVAIAGSAFGLYSFSVANKMKALADEKTELADEMTQLALLNEDLAFKREQELIGKNINHSRYLAATALSLFENNNRLDAALVAAEALPKDKADEAEHPYIPEAEYALSQILYAYSCDDNISIDRQLVHDMSVELVCCSKGYEHTVSTDLGGSVYIWDNDTGSRLAKIEPVFLDNGSRNLPKDIYVDEDYAYVTYTDRLAVFDFYGNDIYEINFAEKVKRAIFNAEENLAYFVGGYGLYTVSLEQQSIISVVNAPGEALFTDRAVYNRDKNQLALGIYNIWEMTSEIVVVDLSTGETFDFATTTGNYAAIEYTKEGKLAAVIAPAPVTQEAIVLMLDPETGEILWQYTLGTGTVMYSGSNVFIGDRNYSDESGEYNELIVAAQTKIISFDKETGNINAECSIPSRVVGIKIAAGTGACRVCDELGEINLLDATLGTLYSDYMYSTHTAVRSMNDGGNICVLAEDDSVNILLLKYHSASDLRMLYEEDERIYSCKLSSGQDYFVYTCRGHVREYIFVDIYGYVLGEKEFCRDSFSEVWGFTADDEFVIAGEDGYVYWYNPMYSDEYSCSIVPDGVAAYTPSAQFITANKKYVLYRAGRKVSVIDLIEKKLLFYFEDENQIANAAISEDGKILFISYADKDFKAIDIEGGTTKVFEYMDIRTVTSSDRSLAVSDSSEYVAVNCYDGFIRVISLENEEVVYEYEVFGGGAGFLEFVPGMPYLIIQSDNKRISIVDVKNGAEISKISREFVGVQDVLYDAMDGFAVVVDSTGVTLLEMSKYSPVAYAPKAIGYIIEDNRFIGCNGSAFYTTYYKNYEELLGEVGWQFPGGYLDDEKRSKYNIE